VEKMREEFAEWFEECTGWEPVEYPNHKIVAMCWLAWRASRDAIVVEIDSHTEFEIEHIASPEKYGYSIGWIDGRNYAAKQVRDAGISIQGKE
jgi:hypothetical protein